MENARTLFLELLTAALWNRAPRENLFQQTGTPVWEEISALASMQKVNALIYDGMMMLPPTLRPEKKIAYQLHLQAEFVEKSNRRVNAILAQLSENYNSVDCPFVLLKGQGNALLYPKPRHRTPGDIDVFLYRPGDYEKANNWAREQGFEMGAENIHHQEFEYYDTLVENHKYVSYFGIAKYDRLLNEIVSEIIAGNEFPAVTIQGVSVRVLPHTFNAFFIFQHLFHHFIHLGVGIRQLCDWVLFWNAYSGHINKEEFNQLATRIGLLNAMQVFASVAVKYLGADPRMFPFAIDTQSEYVDMVMEDIFIGGSFGYALFQHKRFINKWHRKWYTFRCTAKRKRKIKPLAPAHVSSLLMNKIYTNMKLIVKW